VVTLAVYVYFLCTLIGRQYLGDLEKRGDLYVPVFTFLQYLFYMGWLKVATALFDFDPTHPVHVSGGATILEMGG